MFSLNSRSGYVLVADTVWLNLSRLTSPMFIPFFPSDLRFFFFLLVFLPALHRRSPTPSFQLGTRFCFCFRELPTLFTSGATPVFFPDAFLPPRMIPSRGGFIQCRRVFWSFHCFPFFSFYCFSLPLPPIRPALSRESSAPR